MLDQHVGDGVEHPLNISRTDNEEINYKVACSWEKKIFKEIMILKV